MLLTQNRPSSRVTAMNKRRPHWRWLAVPGSLLLAGCLGGTPRPAPPEAQLRAETALKRGIRAEQKGDMLEAESLLIQSLTSSASIEDIPAKTTALINLARLYRLRHDLQRAEASIEQALTTAADDPALSAEAAYEKALIELAKNDPTTALEWAQKAIAAEKGNALGRRLNLAGRIHLVLGNLDQAQRFAEKALAENRSDGQNEEQANSLRILGSVARGEKKYLRGRQLFQEALQIDKRIGKSGKIAADLGELAATARAAGNPAESATWLERAFQVNLAGGRLIQARENQEALADIYMLLGERQKAATARETAQKLGSQIEHQDQGSSSATTNPSNSP